MSSRLASIAARAGVSEATVSRVLNGKPGVSAKTRAGVAAAVDVLGYERPPTLRARKASFVGLIVPELTNPIFPVLVQAVESALVGSGLTPLLCTQTPSGMSEDEYVEMLLDHGVSGVIFVSGMHADTKASTDRYDRLIERGVATVFVNGWLDGVNAAFVSCDDAVAAQLAVGHLHDLGHQRIGLALGPRRYTPVIRRRAGFVAAMRRHTGRIPPAELIAESVFSVEGGYAAGTSLLDAGATAVVCASDLMALGVMRAARARGLDIPSDLSVVGYDDSPLIAFVDPPLSTVRQPIVEIGVAAVRALVDEIRDDAVPRGELLFQPELVVRASTGPAPAAPRN
jgi:DNA-binding LacI/PurR family transcriptional regulator